MRPVNRLETRLLVTVRAVAAASITICVCANIHRERTECLRLMVRSTDRFSDTLKSSLISVNIRSYWGANRGSSPHFGLRMDFGLYEGQLGRNAIERHGKCFSSFQMKDGCKYSHGLEGGR